MTFYTLEESQFKLGASFIKIVFLHKSPVLITFRPSYKKDDIVFKIINFSSLFNELPPWKVRESCIT